MARLSMIMLAAMMCGAMVASAMMDSGSTSEQLLAANKADEGALEVVSAAGRELQGDKGKHDYDEHKRIKVVVVKKHDDDNDDDDDKGKKHYRHYYKKEHHKGFFPVFKFDGKKGRKLMSEADEGALEVVSAAGRELQGDKGKHDYDEHKRIKVVVVKKHDDDNDDDDDKGKKHYRHYYKKEHHKGFFPLFKFDGKKGL